MANKKRRQKKGPAKKRGERKLPDGFDSGGEDVLKALEAIRNKKKGASPAPAPEPKDATPGIPDELKVLAIELKKEYPHKNFSPEENHEWLNEVLKFRELTLKESKNKRKGQNQPDYVNDDDKVVFIRRDQLPQGLNIEDNKKYPVIITKEEEKVNFGVILPDSAVAANQEIRDQLTKTADFDEFILVLAKIKQEIENQLAQVTDQVPEDLKEKSKAFNYILEFIHFPEKYKIINPLATPDPTSSQGTPDAGSSLVEKKYNSRDIIKQLEVSANSRGQLSAQAEDGYPIHISLPASTPRDWKPLREKYDIIIKAIQNNRYLAELMVPLEESNLVDFREDSLDPEQEKRQAELDALLAADYPEDPEQEKRNQLAHLSEAYDEVVKGLSKTMESLQLREINSLGKDDILEIYLAENELVGLIAKIVDFQEDEGVRTFVFRLEEHKYNKTNDKYLANQFLLELNKIKPDLLNEIRITVKIKNGKVINEEHTDLDERFKNSGILKPSLAQQYLDQYDQEESFLERNVIISQIESKLNQVADEIESLRAQYINQDQGNVQELSEKLRVLIIEYNDLKEAYQEIIGHDVEQARLMTLELATPDERKELDKARNEEDYNKRFADLVRQTWAHWAYEAKKNRDGDVDLKSDRDLDSKSLEAILHLAGFDLGRLYFEPVISGQSKPGYIHYDTSYGSGVEYRGDLTTAHIGAEIDYPNLAKTLGVSERKARVLYPDSRKKDKPDRTAAIDHHSLLASQNTSSAEILYRTFKELGVINDKKIQETLKNKFKGEASDLTPEQALHVIEQTIQFISYADSFAHPKMADPDWYTQSDRTLLGLYKVGRIDFIDVSYYFLRNPRGDGTEEIPLSEISLHPFDKNKRRFHDPSFNEKEIARNIRARGKTAKKKDHQIEREVKKAIREQRPTSSIIRKNIDKSQDQIKQLEAQGLIITTDPMGPLNGMSLIIDLGGQNLDGYSEAAYGLKQASYLKWRPVNRGKAQEGVFLSAPNGYLGNSELLTENTSVVRGQMAIQFMPEGEALGFTLEELLTDLGVSREQIDRALENLPESETPPPLTPQEQARQEKIEDVNRNLQGIHVAALSISGGEKNDDYWTIINGYLDELSSQNTRVPVAYLKSKFEQF